MSTQGNPMFPNPINPMYLTDFGEATALQSRIAADVGHAVPMIDMGNRGDPYGGPLGLCQSDIIYVGTKRLFAVVCELSDDSGNITNRIPGNCGLALQAEKNLGGGGVSIKWQATDQGFVIQRERSN